MNSPYQFRSELHKHFQRKQTPVLSMDFFAVVLSTATGVDLNTGLFRFELEAG